VIVDGPSGERDDVWLARSQADAPEIDCLVYLTAAGTSPEAPLTGRIVRAEVVAASGYDLAAVPAEG